MPINFSMLCEECTKTFSLDADELQKFLDSVGYHKAGTEPSTSSQTQSRENPAVTPCPACLSPLALGEDFGEENGTKKSTDEDSGVNKQAEHSIDIEPSPKRCKLSPSPCDLTCCPSVSCVACLGLLEQRYVQHLAGTITKHVHQSELAGMETYSLSIHVPISLSIRRIGMEMCAVKRNTPKSLPMTESHDLTTGSHDHTTLVVTNDHLSENNYVKEGLKWQLRQLLDTSLAPLRWNYESPLMICLNLDHQSSLRDCIGVKKLRPKLFPRPKKRWRTKYQPTPINKLPVEKALEDLTDADMVTEGYFLSPIATPCSHKVEIQHKSVYVAGRYNKYSRKLPQTPWMVDGVKKADTSVQELICPQIVEAFRASDLRFSSSGREDVDVLMLGNGRPFLLELVHPLNISISNADLQRIEESINTGTELIAVKQLRRVGKNSSTLLKQGEEEKKKIYSAVVWTEEEMTPERLKLLDESTDLVLQQNTPIRVLHRRTLAVREKVIYSMKTQQLDPQHFKLQLVTQAGTYIKEFVHGDFGRTQPNIGTLLGCDADILSLNVLEVQLQWPPVE